MKHTYIVIAASTLVVAVVVSAGRTMGDTVPDKAHAVTAGLDRPGQTAAGAEVAGLVSRHEATAGERFAIALNEANSADAERDLSAPMDGATLSARRDAQLVANLNDSVEGSVYASLNVSGVLELAQSLLSSEVDPRAKPVPDPTGSMFFPLRNTPEGLEAELKVSHSSLAKYANVLGLEMKLTRDGDPIYLEGVMREPPVGRVQAWTDARGEILDLTIQTLLEPDYDATESQGLSFQTGQITHGVLYHISVAHPSQSVMKAYGTIDGQTASWVVPMELSGEAWTKGQLDSISDGLLALYADVKSR